MHLLMPNYATETLCNFFSLKTFETFLFVPKNIESFFSHLSSKYIIHQTSPVITNSCNRLPRDIVRMSLLPPCLENVLETSHSKIGVACVQKYDIYQPTPNPQFPKTCRRCKILLKSRINLEFCWQF